MTVERDSVTKTSMMRQLQERVLDRFRRRNSLPNNKKKQPSGLLRKKYT